MFKRCKATTDEKPQAPGKQPKRTNTMTVKLKLDTTELKGTLNRIEKQVDRIIDKITFLKLERDLDKVKNVVINNNIAMENLAKGFERWISKYIRNDIDGTNEDV
ncbi:hypothetical protein AAGC94_19065 [Clostridium sporogenes]|uniref:hypothetical protein n=1 Tax=Clostridium sporogenes TaxID=1509 RepID=UPI00313BF2F5